MKKATTNTKPRKVTPCSSISAETQRRRDAILHGIRHRKSCEGLSEAIELLKAHIETHGKKYTIERETILSKIYHLSTPVDTETLHKMLEEDGMHLSLATVYNTLQLLVKEIHVVKQIDLNGGKQAFYERTLGIGKHFYVVCNKCGTLTSVQNEELMKQIENLCPKQFKIEDTTLLMTGYCHKCQMAIRKAEQRRIEKATRKSRLKKKK